MITKQDKRISEIINSKEFKAIRPISATTREIIRQRHSKYMFFYDKDRIHGTCERCGEKVSFSENTKYKSKVWCPHCKDEMIVLHTWRKPGGCDYEMKWDMDVKAINNEVFVIRYIMMHQFKSYEMEIGEVAREVFDFKTAKRYRISKHLLNDGHGKHEWIWHTANDYFVEFNMYVQRRDFCMLASPVFTERKLFRELSKIDALDYYDWKSKLDTFYLLSDNIKGLLSAPLYEKMEKVGLGDMAARDFGYGKISWNPKETSIVKMLRLDKKHYNLFMEKPSVTALGFLQMYRKIPEADYRYARDRDIFDKYRQLRMLKIQHPMTAMNYVERRKVNWIDYIDYLGRIKGLDYDMTDKSYIYPNDFRKADVRTMRELDEKEREERAKADHERAMLMAKQNDKIKEISDGLRAMPNLKDFLGGSRGFLVYVPDSAEDILTEGRNQHNCVGSYVDRIAQKKTLVFFIRKLDCPDASFVTMEYCNGEVIQARYDYNIDVFTGKDSCGRQVMDIDNNLVDFTNALAEILRKNKVMIA